MNQSLVASLLNLIAIPDFTRGAWRVSRRHYVIALYRPILLAMVLIGEPLIQLLAFGVGLGYWLQEIGGRPYGEFAVAGVAAMTCILVPYWELAFGAFSRLRSQAVYWSMLQGPITAKDIGNGELIWGMVRGALAGQIVLVVGASLGWVKWTWLLAGPMVLLPGALVGSAFALWCAVVVRQSMTLVLIQVLALGPVLLWSETLFPTSEMGAVGDWLMMISPVAHLSKAIRSISTGEISAEFFLNLAVLWALASIGANVASRRFARTLIPG